VTVEFRSPSHDNVPFVTRLVFVHGSVGNAAATWSAQRSLEDRFECVFLTRGGYLVGHSYGGVVSLLAAARRPVLASLTVGEPPCFGVARGHPAVEDFLSRFESFHASGPREYLEFFLPLVGTAITVPDELPPALEQGARAAMAERTPDQAVVPLDELTAAPFPKLVMSGAHSPAFDAVCDVLEQRLPALRAVVPGAGHSLPRAPGYNDALTAFVESTS
jgi:pimeloyl-ACP methyl ester carboxylesterase